jgi:hypothetical protein
MVPRRTTQMQKQRIVLIPSPVRWNSAEVHGVARGEQRRTKESRTFARRSTIDRARFLDSLRSLPRNCHCELTHGARTRDSAYEKRHDQARSPRPTSLRAIHGACAPLRMEKTRARVIARSVATKQSPLWRGRRSLRLRLAMTGVLVAAPRLGGEAISECRSGDSAAALTVARRGRSLLAMAFLAY